MAGFKGRGRGRGGPAKGLFVEGVWHCDCDPRMTAVHFQTKKAGPNQGRWFRTCQKDRNDKTKCAFYLWDDDAQPREQAALMKNSRTEPERTIPTTPSKRQVSPPPPYMTRSSPPKSSRKRMRTSSETVDDDYGFGQADDGFNDELNQVMTDIETPSKAVKTSEFATPAAGRRKLPWQLDQPVSGSTIGLQTPQTIRKAPSDPFASKPIALGASLHTPSKVVDDQIHQPTTPSSFCDTPTPNRFRHVAAEDLVQDVFNLLQESNIRPDEHTATELKALLSKHAKNTEGYKRGRDVIRTTVKAKDAKITELSYRVGTLEAELEAEKAMVKHLQWEAQNVLPET